MASTSSSANPPHKKYDVFLSFRGEDTRSGFTSYLYAALCEKGFSTYMDEHKLERGDEISPTLLKAIEESKISVVIFSKNYASSTWCLNELVHILECKKNNGQIVMPIFYGIDPSDVRKQNGSYGMAFAKHEESFRDRIKEVHQWRAALKEVSNLCGLDSKNFRLENELVKQVVKDILEKLPKYRSTYEHSKELLFGIEKNIKEVESLLSIGSEDIRIIGIWGMGGIGKTTLATIVLEKLSDEFDGRCFLWNDRKQYATHGLDHLLDDVDNLRMDTLVGASSFILHRLRRKKMLIVVDDVDSSILLDALVRECRHRLAPGSRIIVTSRNRQVLKGVSDDIYKVQRLNSIESSKLFRLYAFKSNHPPAIDDENMISQVISYAYGNPLALKILGSSLLSRNKEEWESALKKLKRFSNPDIQDVLRISYDQLDDKGMKDTFLDIACIFDSSFTRDYAESILIDNPSVKSDITDLIEKSLIEKGEVLEDNVLLMNDLIRQMGRQIARDERQQPGNRCRLCDAKDACYVLENETGTAAIEVISFNMSEITQNVRVCPAAFSNMCNLRILKVYCDNIGGYVFKLSIPNGLDSYLSNKLRYFRWDLYPLKSLPSKFNPENLVELALRGSHLENLWNYKVQSLPMLRRIDLSHSKFLTQLPDLSRSPNLERINLEGCTCLVEVLSSIQNLDKLAYLNLNGCTELKNLKDISRSTGCLDFILHCIENLSMDICQLSLTSQAHISQKFPVNLTRLLLRETAIEEVDPSIGYLSGLVELDMSYCTRLQCLPASVCNLKSLEMLSLHSCSKLEKLPPLPSALLHMDLYRCESLKSLSELPLLCFSLCAPYCKTLENISTWRAPLLHNMKIINHTFFYGNIDFYGCEKLDQNTRNSILADRAVLKLLYRMKFGTSEMKFQSGLTIKLVGLQ
ncbi:disease resistance protein RPV1-like isoform X2 [Ziziphus jujuba]|uniref:Disease resistance protein RPV1-like isoform X2 n=1 Tax=Ziziphus jujuba TaxID=326968 RepID=A0ABM4ABE9_ZIZJJ|nr:disease resistance protein RPV1-like isoform X2 [Ziziphus jujuba]